MLAKDLIKPPFLSTYSNDSHKDYRSELELHFLFNSPNSFQAQQSSPRVSYYPLGTQSCVQKDLLVYSKVPREFPFGKQMNLY